MFTSVALYLCASLLFLSPHSTIAQIDQNPVSDTRVPLFVFGDSLYDNGMTLYNGIKGAGAEFWPYGDTYFKNPAGRYSDGRLIPDFIAEYAGLNFLEPYLLPELKDFTKGVNFASAGSCALVETRPNTISLKKQMEYFYEMVLKLKQQVGEVEANKLISKAVYMFNIGGNDYVTLFERSLDKQNRPHVSPSQKKLKINQIIGNLTNHVKTIYYNGGRKFAFQNLGPLGCMPSMKSMLGFEGTCMEEPEDLARMHNAAFSATMKDLESQLPNFKYSIYDFYSALSSRILNSDQYGLKESQIACCGSGAFNGEFTCQKKGTNFAVCSNPNEYLWFDAAHPTDKANQQLSQEFWDGNSSLVAPYNLWNLFNMNIEDK